MVSGGTGESKQSHDLIAEQSSGRVRVELTIGIHSDITPVTLEGPTGLSIQLPVRLDR